MKFRPAVLIVFVMGCSSKGAEPTAAPAPAPVVAAPAPAPAVDAAVAVDAFERVVDFGLKPAEEGKMGSSRKEGRAGDGRALALSMSDEDVAAAQALIGPDAGKRLAELIERNEEAAKHRPPSLTPAEIDKVVKSRASHYKACYSKELERKPDLAGKVVVNLSISAEGAVTEVKIDPDRSTLLDEDVSSCLRRQFSKLRFPAKGGATVNYPLLFSKG